MESEFDKRFVDLDLVLNLLNETTDRSKDRSNEKSTDESTDNQKESTAQAKNTLNEISSIFAQLAHKASTLTTNGRIQQNSNSLSECSFI